MAATMRAAVAWICLAALLLGPSSARADAVDAPPPPPGRPMKLGGVLFAAAGLILVGGGVGLSLRAGDAWDEIDEARGRGLPWTDELQRTYDGAERDETLAAVFYVAGGMTIVAGAVFYRMGIRRDRIAVTPTRGGGAATFTWSF
jgi:hypothetical protein